MCDPRYFLRVRRQLSRRGPITSRIANNWKNKKKLPILPRVYAILFGFSYPFRKENAPDLKLLENTSLWEREMIYSRWILWRRIIQHCGPKETNICNYTATEETILFPFTSTLGSYSLQKKLKKKVSKHQEDPYGQWVTRDSGTESEYSKFPGVRIFWTHVWSENTMVPTLVLLFQANWSFNFI